MLFRYRMAGTMGNISPANDPLDSESFGGRHMSWQEQITNPEEVKVFEALADKQWDFWTVPGIVKETGLSENRVKEVVAKYPDLIRESAIPDTEGRRLFTLRSRPVKFRERLAMIRAFLAKSLH
jgi:hypothetical protein